MTQRGSDELHPGELEVLETLQPGDSEWLRKVRASYQASTDFLDDGIRKEWDSALSRFHSEHPAGSKYHTKAYQHRSKLFRPRTRSFSRRSEARAAAALFSNTDLIDVRGQNRGSEYQAAAARYNKALLQYRLEHSIPWFVTCMGARQDTFNHGVCVSLTTWEYREQRTTSYVPALDDMGQPIVDDDGAELGEEIENVEIIEDKPVIDLLPPENVRFDPNADWRNPIADSPCVTVMLPMYAGEIQERMTRPNPVTNEPEWREYGLKTILAAAQDKDINEVIRSARAGKYRQDPLDTIQGDENTLAWVWLNIMRDEEGEDYAFYTLGEQLMLTDPEPVRKVLPLGRDSLTFGFSVVEAHRAYPSGGNTLAAPMQAEVNDVANQRMDNVKLALNRRYFVRRNSQVDMAALARSVPGGSVMAGDPDKDVRVLDFPDVTGSSYQEQDRLTQELDELMGNFSSSSVQANRSLNETVGGMNMLMGDASEVAEYELRTFVETWVEPVLRNLQKLIAMFETDETILAVAAENAELPKYGEAPELDRMLDEEMVVSVNVGMGNTNPQQRLQRFQMVIAAAANIPEIAQRMNPEEIGKEIFALGGFSDTTRFMMSEEELKEKAEAQQGQPDPSMQVAQIKAQADMQVAQVKAETDQQIAQMRAQIDQYKTDKQYEFDVMELLEQQDAKLTELYAKMGVDREKIQSDRDVTAVKEGSRMQEMRLRRDTGAGI